MSRLRLGGSYPEKGKDGFCGGKATSTEPPEMDPKTTEEARGYPGLSDKF